MYYLDDLQVYPEPTSEETREEVKTKGQEWIRNCDFRGSLNDAYKIWDSVSALRPCENSIIQTRGVGIQGRESCWRQGEE